MSMNIDEVDEGIAAKLIKLIAVAHRSTEIGEVENAMAAARRMAILHDIDLESVSVEQAGVSSYRVGMSDEPFDDVELKTAKGKHRRPPSHKWISSILTEHFKVDIVWRGSVINIIGRRSDVAFARYAYGFLHHTFTRCWRKYKQENQAMMSARNSYFSGICAGLSTKLAAAAADAKEEALKGLNNGDDVGRSYALTVVKEKDLLKQAVSGKHPEIRYVKVAYDKNIDDSHARHYGFRDGNNIDILMPLPSEQSSNTKKPLLGILDKVP